MGLKGSFRGTFTVPAPARVARDHFADVERVCRLHGHLASWRKIDARTAHMVLSPNRTGMSVFQGVYDCIYEPVGEDRLVWRTVGKANVDSRGEARFTDNGKGGCTLDYTQEIELDTGTNAMLAKMLAPIVTASVSKETREYVERMIADLS